MNPRKLDVFFVFYAYGGNGAIASEDPHIREWFAKTVVHCKRDPRIGEVDYITLCDTPITMTRNRAVELAQRKGSDVLVMVDSDQQPDMYVGTDEHARPFFDVGFNLIYSHWEKGPVAILAPYCGPPPHPVMGGEENVYMFRWSTAESDSGEATSMKLSQYTREEAAERVGLEPVAAGPTGLSMWGMSSADKGGVFDLVPPPYFYYEYVGDGAKCAQCGCSKPGPQSQKASTEDVTASRDISLNGIIKLGYNPLYAAWDCWAGHMKAKCVGKPKLIPVDHVASKLVDAVARNRRSNEKIVFVGGDGHQGLKGRNGELVARS